VQQGQISITRAIDQDCDAFNKRTKILGRAPKAGLEGETRRGDVGLFQEDEAKTTKSLRL
jgi:hypothetical protein